MTATDGESDLVRIVFGRSGEVKFHTELVIRFGYGAIVPWVSRAEDGTVHAIAGPERVVLHTPVALYGEDLKTVGEFTVSAGQSVPFVLFLHLRVQVRRSTHSRRWKRPGRFGASGAVVVPMSDFGPALLSVR